MWQVYRLLIYSQTVLEFQILRWLRKLLIMKKLRTERLCWRLVIKLISCSFEPCWHYILLDAAMSLIISIYVKEGVPKHLRIFKLKENINWKKIQWWDSTVIYCAYLSKVLSKIFLHSLYALGYPIWWAWPHSSPGYIYIPCFAVRATPSYAIGRGTKTRELFFALLWSVYDLTLHSIVALTLLNLSEYHT